jgi:hypothetical protein
VACSDGHVGRANQRSGDTRIADAHHELDDAIRTWAAAVHHRLRFYQLAMHLSLVAAPLRILDGDFPDRDGMMGTAEHNLNRALALVR